MPPVRQRGKTPLIQGLQWHKSEHRRSRKNFMESPFLYKGKEPKFITPPHGRALVRLIHPSVPLLKTHYHLASKETRLQLIYDQDLFCKLRLRIKILFL